MSYWKLTTVFLKGGGGMGTVGQSLRDCKLHLVGRCAIVGSRTWRSSCRDRLLELSVPWVPGSLGVQTVWPTGLAGQLLVYGVVQLIEYALSAVR